MRKIIDKFVDGSVAIVNKFLPDAFIFAALLTFVVFIAAAVVMFVNGGDVASVIQDPNVAGTELAGGFIGKLAGLVYDGWYGAKGFWSLLAFSMQMSLIIITGDLFANTPQIKKFMVWLARIPKTPGQAVAFEAFFSIFVSFFQWGAALIMSAMLAKEIARNVPGTHFALLVACGYLGLGMWHGGFSGSVPLVLPDGNYPMANGVAMGSMPITFKYTLFAPFNLFNYVGGMIILPLVFLGLHPKGEKVVTCDPAVLVEEEVEEVKIPRSEMLPNDKMNNSRAITIGLFLIGAAVIVIYIIKMIGKPFTLDINFVNFLFLFLSILLYGNPLKLVNAVNKAASGAAGVMLQFPFYGGICGLMVYDGGFAANNSLAEVIANFFVRISTPTTYNLFTFLSAGLINFFIPSGGGQWAVQGPIVMPASHEKVLTEIIGKDYVTTTFDQLSAAEQETYKKYMGKSAMSLAWGDAWTNLIQPFWALPLLAIAKLQAKDIMGYCVLALIILGIWCSIGFLLL